MAKRERLKIDFDSPAVMAARSAGAWVERWEPCSPGSPSSSLQAPPCAWEGLQGFGGSFADPLQIWDICKNCVGSRKKARSSEI